jgi:hypothetical protein
VSVAQDIASARGLFEQAEREANPELKAHALDEALALLSSCDPDEISEAERKLIANLRLAHARRLLVQLVGLSSVSMDAWFEYIGLLFGELRSEVDRLTESDPELKENYGRFLELWGSDVADILQRQNGLEAP